MRRFLTLLAGLLLTVTSVYAQSTRKTDAQTRQHTTTNDKTSSSKTEKGGYMLYTIEGKDTVYMDSIRPAKVFEKMPKQKGREWRKYYRLVYNFSKAYPYALVAKNLVRQADSTIAANHWNRAQKEKYINAVQDELFSVFEKQMKNLTVSQGMLIMKLIDREVGESSYDLIKGFKNRMAAGFWQGIAKLFGSDMKKHYDPDGDDKATEELVKIWQDGDFPAFYYSLFWEYPPEVKIPEKYLK